MKTKLLCLLALLSILAMGCTKVQVTKPPPLNVLQGTYNGQFMSVHTNTPKNDTLTANLQLTLTSSFGYSVTGDTSVVHAGSHGSFEITSGTQLQFFDLTYPSSGTPTKIHLSGIYRYTFDHIYLDVNGTNPAGTTTYSYTLTKIN